MTTTKTLRRATDSTWIDASGNFTISYYSWNTRTTPWVARWTDVLGGKHEIWEYSRARLIKRLQAYGDVRYVLARAR